MVGHYPKIVMQVGFTLLLIHKCRSDSKRTVYLDFNSVTAEAAGEYECVASREAGDSVRQTVMLEVSA